MAKTALHIVPINELLGRKDKKDSYVGSTKTGLSWARIEQIARFSVPVFSVISTRIKQIISLEWQIVPIHQEEDALKTHIISKVNLYEEFKEDPIYEHVAIEAVEQLKTDLPLLKDDLTNVWSCYERRKNEIRKKRRREIKKIKNFFLQPNREEDFSEFMHKVLWDLLVFGKSSIYKILSAGRLINNDGMITEMVSLKGSSVIPRKGVKILSTTGYYQFVKEPFSLDKAIFFELDEISYLQYLPNNYSIHGLTPIEVIVQLVAENLFYDTKRVKEFEDGRPPEGLLLLNQVDEESEKSESSESVSEEQKESVNDEINKRSQLEDTIKVLTGVDKVQFIDFSRKEHDFKGLERSEFIWRAVALAYNMNPQEIGLVEDVNRSTAEVQEQSERRKGIKPLLQEIENKFTAEFIHEMGFTNYKFQYTSEENRRATAKIYKDEAFWKSPNEIRVEDGREPYPEKMYDRPIPQGAGTQQSGESEEREEEK